MGAWIEIFLTSKRNKKWLVAPHDGCVDWNKLELISKQHDIEVAPHDGCVDWNSGMKHYGYMKDGRTPRWVRGLKLKEDTDTEKETAVAPHDGCVDWNRVLMQWECSAILSHPTMGAWIEIIKWEEFRKPTPWSHPTMGAWIEIYEWYANITFAPSHPTMGAWIEILRLL